MEIRYDKDAVKFLKSMQKSTRERIQQAIAGLTKQPADGDIRPMQGYKDGRYRLRVGTYRVIYKYLKDGVIDILYIIDIGNRGDIYK